MRTSPIHLDEAPRLQRVERTVRLDSIHPGDPSDLARSRRAESGEVQERHRLVLREADRLQLFGGLAQLHLIGPKSGRRTDPKERLAAPRRFRARH